MKTGVRQELTIPKTPQQNGVAQRMNRTLVETVRSMLADGKLPHINFGQRRCSLLLTCKPKPYESGQGHDSLLRLRHARNQNLNICEFLGVRRTLIYRKIRDRNWTQKRENVLSWAMVQKQKDIGYMTCVQEFFTVKMCVQRVTIKKSIYGI